MCQYQMSKETRCIGKETNCHSVFDAKRDPLYIKRDQLPLAYLRSAKYGSVLDVKRDLLHIKRNLPYIKRALPTQAIPDERWG